MIIQLRPNPDKDTGLTVTKRAARILGEYPSVRLCIAPEFLSAMEEDLLPVCSSEGLEPDMYLVMGGDGSVIRTAHRAAEKGIPILSVNLGRMGYLCEVEPDRLSLLKKIPEGAYTLEKRSMLKLAWMRGETELLRRDGILNDVCVTRAVFSGIADFTVTADGGRTATYRADGAVIFTPTGSTGYAMSAGGPAMDPALSVIGCIPICPHAGQSRAILFRDTTVLELCNTCGFGGRLYLTSDGIGIAAMEPGDILRVEKSELYAALVRIDGNPKGDRLV